MLADLDAGYTAPPELTDLQAANSAHIGDVLTSLIHTAELCACNSLDYLVAVPRHRQAPAPHPAQWMIWNYLLRDRPGLDYDATHAYRMDTEIRPAQMIDLGSVSFSLP